MDERLTSAQLLEHAKAQGFVVTERRFEDWRYRGLLPRPERAGNSGRSPRWLYPAETADQLVALCRYRETTKDLEAIHVALWVDGYAIDEQSVRAAIASVLTGMRDRIEKALAEGSKPAEGAADPSSPDDALDAVALQAAGKHGDRPTPRTVRMPKAGRARGIAFMVRLFMGYDLDDHLTDAKFAEQAMGLSAGRRGPAPYRWLDGNPEELADLRSIISLPVLIDSVSTATDEELVRARGFARAFVHGLPLIALFAEAVLGPRAAGLAAAKNIDDQPEFLCMLVPALVSAVRHGYGENLNLIQPALSGVAREVGPLIEELAALPEAERQRAIQDRPAIARPTLRRLVSLYANTKNPTSGRKKTPT
jgi:hypothetical protein